MNITDQQMLIDGNLVGAGNGQTYEVVNPATEEVVGTAPDAQVEDVERAIAAARRAFDETDWSTNKELRKRCLRQLQACHCTCERAYTTKKDIITFWMM